MNIHSPTHHIPTRHQPVVTWKTKSNYTLTDEEAAANTYITNVNPIFMGALGQAAGTESRMYAGFSSSVVEGLKSIYLETFPEIFKYAGRVLNQFPC